MTAQTVSEEAFEAYLATQDISARYEELPEGVTRPADYSFEVAGRTLRFEVKEWDPQPLKPGIQAVDRYGPIREKINEGRYKFQQYKGRGEPCVLVLCNYGSPLIRLDDAAIYGAMLGDVGWTFPLGRQQDASETLGRQTFLRGGKMLHVSKDDARVQNTTLSAIAVLSSIDVTSRQVAAELARREKSLERELSINERIDMYLALAEEREEQVETRLSIYDNPFATELLPPSFPSGKFDERFGSRDDQVTRTFVGDELRMIEMEEATVGIRRNDPFGLRR